MYHQCFLTVSYFSYSRWFTCNCLQVRGSVLLIWHKRTSSGAVASSDARYVCLHFPCVTRTIYKCYCISVQSYGLDQFLLVHTVQTDIYSTNKHLTCLSEHTERSDFIYCDFHRQCEWHIHRTKLSLRFLISTKHTSIACPKFPSLSCNQSK